MRDDFRLNRAAADFSCPAQQITIQPIDGACGAAHHDGDTCTAQARGCNKRATYVFVWRQQGNNTWILNSPVSESDAASR